MSHKKQILSRANDNSFDRYVLILHVCVICGGLRSPADTYDSKSKTKSKSKSKKLLFIVGTL